MNKKAKNFGDWIFSFVLLYAIWKLISLSINQDIIFPSPRKVFSVLIELISSKKLWMAILYTSIRVLFAFTISIIVGSVLGYLCGISSRIEIIIRPFITFARATPVLAIILVAMIWFPSDIVPIFSAFLMAFPAVTSSVSQGIKSINSNYIKMAHAYSLPEKIIITKIRLPFAFPFFLSSAKTAIGLSWKVVIAGEVLSGPKFAIGTRMQTSRIMLETSEVFAWAIVGIFMCSICDYLFTLLIRKNRWTTK